MPVYWNRSLLKRRMELVIVGGQNRLSARPKSKYIMKETSEPGVVSVGKSEFYFLGFEHAASGTRNIGKAAAGAIVGGVLTGGIGLIAGGAIGGCKKDTSKAEIVFADIQTGKPFSVIVECDDYLRDRLARLSVADVEIAEV